jgi:hypothetical protein
LAKLLKLKLFIRHKLQKHKDNTLVILFLLIYLGYIFPAKTELDIEEYSFSQTTLEQVFLKFAHYDEVNGD